MQNNLSEKNVRAADLWDMGRYREALAIWDEVVASSTQTPLLTYNPLAEARINIVVMAVRREVNAASLMQMNARTKVVIGKELSDHSGVYSDETVTLGQLLIDSGKAASHR